MDIHHQITNETHLRQLAQMLLAQNYLLNDRIAKLETYTAQLENAFRPDKMEIEAICERVYDYWDDFEEPQRQHYRELAHKFVRAFVNVK